MFWISWILPEERRFIAETPDSRRRGGRTESLIVLFDVVKKKKKSDINGNLAARTKTLDFSF